ncbi:DNA internalization-related competence protein ComEC/Rec2 [Luteimonas aquatica]|uniref:DNA internalization-related competence protein ComEC/Rec2 n=1 Tax=Luteimonas aquatica TaxID=450364 RepID=UPI001F59551F|nr:DNA internalization-related competence protein ComEC/Rec2 [Luteimonas aquatica]
MAAAGAGGERRSRASAFGAAVAAAFTAGLLACACLPALPPGGLLACALALGAMLWLRAGAGRVPGAALAGFALFGLHAMHGLAQQLPPSLERREATVSGRVSGLPEWQARRTRFLFRVDDDAAQPPALRGRLLQLSWYAERGDARPDRRQALAAGSRWRFALRLQAPRGLRNPGGFDSEKSALVQGIAATGSVRDPWRAQRLAPASGIDAWRERMSARIAAAVASPSARYIQALSLGDTRALEDADWRVLRATGTTHLIAISGFHVGMVASLFAFAAMLLWRWLPALALRLPRPQAMAAASLLGAAGYALASGCALPTMRTVLMIAVAVSARALRRPVRVADALALAALALLLSDPMAVLGAGFWLSFAGVAWLAWCLPRGDAAGGGARVVGDFLSAQAVATLGLLPLSALLFGQASLAGPLANLVAIPWWSLVVVPLSLLGTALEAFHAGWGGGAWRAAAWCFDLVWPAFVALADSRFALWWLPEPDWFALPLALLGAFWCLLPRGVPGKTLALLLWLPLLWPDRRLPEAGEAELVVLDVGQGLSVLVRTAGHSLLYDMGPGETPARDARQAMPARARPPAAPPASAGERVVLPALHALGVRRLDAAVVSHGDGDHIGGFAAVRAGMPMARVFAPEGIAAFDAHPQRDCRAGLAWEWDGVRFRFLHPPPDFPYLANESSCVLRVETAHGAFLLTGDIGEVVERDLVRRDAASLRAEVVVIAHHGSRESSDPAFVAATGARLALVSAGYGNRYRHPHPSAMRRWREAGAAAAATFDGGALRVRLRGGGRVLETWRRARPRSWDAVRRMRIARDQEEER